MKNQKTGLFILIFVIIVSRIPFLSSGYGSEPDAWRLANVSRNISVNNEYRHMSRYPGHPAQELFCSLIWQGGPIALNGVTAFLSSLSFVMFAFMLKNLKIANYLLITYAVAFTPVVYINSINSMDYMWALSFILISFYFVFKNKFVLSGVFTGLAIGSRITSGAMLLPLCYIIYTGVENNKKRQMIKLAVISVCVAGIIYIPVIMRFGTSFFQFEMTEYPPVLYVLKNLSAGVWGLPGMIAVCLGVFFIFFDYKNNRNRIKKPEKTMIIISYMVIMLYFTSFFYAPLKPGYLIPIVPFVILLFYYYLSEIKFRFICYSIIASSFLFGLFFATPDNSDSNYHSFNISIAGNRLVLDILKGPLFLENSKRNEGITKVNNIIRKGKLINNNSVVETGEMLPLIETTLRSDKDGYVEYCYLFNRNEMNSYIQKGYGLYFLPEVNKANVLHFGFDPADFGAKPFLTY